jgi:hypothetical protein
MPISEEEEEKEGPEDTPGKNNHLPKRLDPTKLRSQYSRANAQNQNQWESVGDRNSCHRTACMRVIALCVRAS